MRRDASHRPAVRISCTAPMHGSCARRRKPPQHEHLPGDGRRLPSVVPSPASRRPGRRPTATVKLTYAGHSTYVIETPGGVRIATDFSGVLRHRPAAARRHHEQGAPHPLHRLPGSRHRTCAARLEPRGRPGQTCAHRRRRLHPQRADRHPQTAQRWRPTATRSSSSRSPACASAISAICTTGSRIAHYAAIGRLDVVMVPVDGGMTQSLENMQRDHRSAAVVRSCCRCTATRRRSPSSPD